MLPKIIFSRHAIYQMKERNLNEFEIFSAIAKPHKIIDCSEDKFKAVKTVKRNGKTYLLVVVCRKSNSSVKVITAFLTSKINKYLK